MYILLNLFRIVCMFFIPLDPPDGIIPLNDTFLKNTVYEGGLNLKDLFFSGHTATLFLFFFFVKNNWFKLFFFLAACSVAFALVIQHVHYSLDIIAAPFFAFLSWKIITIVFKLYTKTEGALL
jgi:membrane-associated phospholipid phosphatase